MKMPKICPVCLIHYMGRSNQKQCSSSCRHKAFLARANDPTNAAPPISTPPMVVIQSMPDRQSARLVNKPRPAPTQSPKATLVLDPQPEANPPSQPRLDKKERQRQRDHERQQQDNKHAHELQMAQLPLPPIAPSPAPPVLSAGPSLEVASLSPPLLLSPPPTIPAPRVDKPPTAKGSWVQDVAIIVAAGALVGLGSALWSAKPTKPTRPLAPARPPQPKPAQGSAPVGQPTVPSAQPPLGAKPSQKQEAEDAYIQASLNPPVGPLLAYIDSLPKKKSKKARKLL